MTRSFPARALRRDFDSTAFGAWRRHAAAAAAMCLAGAAQAQQTDTAAPGAEAVSAAPAPTATLPEIAVKAAAEGEERSQRSGSYTVRRSRSATGLALSARETPQSVSVITRAQMDDFRLDSVNDVLEATTGVVVERAETDRTYYSARGYDITNFQLDGIGLPFAYGNVDGDLDTAVYDRVDVIRGANGLMSGTGNPSATVNYVRKRPSAARQASAALALGSWNDRRVDADISGPLLPGRGVRGRVVAALQDRDSYLDRYHHRKGIVYAAVEADVGERSVLTVGHTQQANRPTGVLWGALPLSFSDGTPTRYERSTSTSTDWTYWNTDTGASFAEALHELDHGWQAKAVLTRKTMRSRSKLFYVYGEPDAQTGLGLAAYPSRYELDQTQNIVDLRASGPLTLAGREHELMVGASVSRSELQDRSMHGVGIGNPVPDLRTWNGDYPEPEFSLPGGGSSFVDKQRSLYAVARINPADQVKLIVGASAVSVDSSGESYRVSRSTSERKLSPYFGAIVDLSRDWSVYASRTAIFKAQSEVDASRNRLAPATGSSVELGLKTELLDRRLIGSVALFRTRQNNLAGNADFVNGVSIYEGTDTVAKGFELELAGALTSRLRLNAGYTQLSLKDRAGEDARTYTPRRLLRVATTYQVPAIDKLKLGATLNWRSGTQRDGAAGVPVRQPSYALLNLMARYQLSERLSATLNIANVTDRRYLTSLYWPQSFYGAPRHGSVSLSWTY
jgi:outer membrane receptor for ferric coprogen and ferric-rhodotorulic acid